MSAEDYLAMSDREFERALFSSLPEELRHRIAQAKSADESEKEKLVEQITRHFSAELTEAMCERESRKMAVEIITEATPITELFAETGIALPAQLSGLRLPRLCSAGGYCREWPKATWSHILGQRQALAEAKRWGLLDDVVRLCRAVEPVMRNAPAMTLAEALKAAA